MRPAVLLSLAVLSALSACASTGDWRDIQRERIDRLHQGRTPYVALREVMQRAPAPVAAEVRRLLPAPDPIAVAKQASRDAKGPAQVAVATAPQDHIDQRLPPADGQGPRSFHRTFQPLVVTADVGVGEVAARVGGGNLDDRTDAMFARVRVDAGPGAAIHAEFTSSDADLFADRMISDGLVPARGNAEVSGVDLFPHVRFDQQWGEWQIPVRFGLFGDYQQLDHQRARVERDWISFGPRLLVEPTWNLMASGQGRLDLVTRIGGDLGAAWFAEEFRNGDSSDSALRWTGEVGAALRGTYGALHAELGYRLQHTTFSALDGDLYGGQNRSELQRQQVFLGFGFTY